MNKVTKLFSVLLLSLGANVMSYGKGIDETAAKNVGSKYLISHGVSGVQSAVDLSTTYVATATVGGKTIVDYYVFNITNGTGFVMVTGDDLVQPVLAYSSEQSFDFDKMSPDAKWWIEGYQNQITYVIEHNIPAENSVTAEWAGLQSSTSDMAGARTTTVSALLTTTWDQIPYYNYQCPVPGASGTPTGCVATAMAQIMRYHSWPAVGTGYHSYTSTTGSYNLSADFGNTVYNWAGMPNAISTNNSSIGLLMKHVGVSVNMDYTLSASGSGAYTISLFSPTTYCAEYALKAFFHYKTSLQGLARSGGMGGVPAPISQTTWIATLKTEMDAHRPVLYSGFGTSGGHAWVCDGYDASSNMHFNWGWGGVGPNGYYSVNSIAPTGLGAGGGGGNFNNNQDIIIGITPDVLPTSGTGNIKMLSHVDCTTQSPISYVGGLSVTAKIMNGGTSSFTGDICAQIFDANNNYAGTVQTYTGKTIAVGDSSASLTFVSSSMPGMVPGEYGIRILYRPTGTSTWSLAADNGNFLNYNAVDVMNHQIVQLYDSLHVGSHVIVRGASINVNTKLINQGGSSFNGTVQAVLTNISTGAQFTVQSLSGQTIGSNATKSFTFANSSVTASAGTYVLAIKHQQTGIGSLITTGSDYYTNPILFTIMAPAGINPVVENLEQVTLYPNPASDVLNISANGVQIDKVRIMDMQGRLLETINAGSQAVISVPTSSYPSGVYFVQLQSGNDAITRKIVIAK